MAAFARATTEAARRALADNHRALPRSIEEFTYWSWTTAGLPLHIPSMYAPAVIDYYIHSACPHLSSAGKEHRHTLLRHAQNVFRTWPAPKLPPIKAAKADIPYTTAELTSILSWARVQGTPKQRSDAHTLIALTLGAGLTTVEVIRAKVCDIDRRRGIDIHIGTATPRTVPMLQTYETLLPMTEDRSGSEYVFRRGRETDSHNTVANFTHRSTEAQLHPVPARLRATWVSTHLSNETPLDLVADAAGLTLNQFVGRYGRLISPTSDRTDRLRYG